QKRVGELSGGERNRLQLAKILQQGANVILLDEPSNDLDVETLRALEDAILVFPGCVMVVSHDRWFLDRIATHILSFEDETPEFFTGNYTEFEEYRRKKYGDDLAAKRQKYRKIGA
ncbi:ATP-binding cassette domain-containing protein, partial [Acinetobacter variabilis]